MIDIRSDLFKRCATAGHFRSRYPRMDSSGYF